VNRSWSVLLSKTSAGQPPCSGTQASRLKPELYAASELRLSGVAASVSPCPTEAEHFMSEML